MCPKWRRSAAADLGDEDDLAVRVERGEVGILKDLAVDCHRYPLRFGSQGQERLRCRGRAGLPRRNPRQPLAELDCIDPTLPIGDEGINV